MRYKAVFRGVRGNVCRECHIEAGSRSEAYWKALGHAIAAGMWLSVEVRRDG